MSDPIEPGNPVRRRRGGGASSKLRAGVYWRAGIFIFLLWSFYLLKVIFHFDLIAVLRPGLNDPNDRKPFDPTPVYLIVAIVGTVVLTIWAFLKSHKVSDLARNGARTTGTVVEKSPLKHHGMVPTTITYEVDGKTYRFRRDMRDRDFNVGDTVTIAYDPSRPTRREVM